MPAVQESPKPFITETVLYFPSKGARPLPAEVLTIRNDAVEISVRNGRHVYVKDAVLHADNHRIQEGEAPDGYWDLSEMGRLLRKSTSGFNAAAELTKLAAAVAKVEDRVTKLEDASKKYASVANQVAGIKVDVNVLKQALDLTPTAS